MANRTAWTDTFFALLIVTILALSSLGGGGGKR